MEIETLGECSFEIYTQLCSRGHRFDDTICPVDFVTHGQIDSDTVS